MATEYNYKEERKGSPEYYGMAVLQYCTTKGIEQSTIEHKPERTFTKREMGAIVNVFNNERTKATLQNCIDNVDAIMSVVERGIKSTDIYLFANPFNSHDKCLGYVDESIVAKRA